MKHSIMKKDFSIKEFSTIGDFKEDYQKLAAKDCSYCQRYLWAKYTEDFCQSSFWRRVYFGNFKYLCLYEDKEIVLVLPYTMSGKKCCIAGKKTPNDYNGFLYDTNVRGGGGGGKTGYFVLKNADLYLMELWTSKEYRGKGIMGDLISYLVHKDNLKSGIVSLCVRKDNRSAIRCYEKNNFKIVRRLKFLHIIWPFDIPNYYV